jgi:pimeloyl-ACP methyl ester carboxylesterase
MQLAATPAFHEIVADGVTLAYYDEGPRDGAPIILVHGFGSNARVNWVQTGWFDLLAKAGRRVVAFDNRGHGRSSKFHAAADYDLPTRMAEDVRRVMDGLGLGRADVMGYSMGAWIAAYFAIAHPERVRGLILSGLAGAIVHGLSGQEDIAAGLEADDDDSVAGRKALTYRAFARRTGSDMKALAACMRGSRRPIAPADLARLTMPVLVAVGEKDDVAGDPAELMPHLAHADLLAIPGRDHMAAVGDKVHKAGVLDFLARRP